MIQAVVKKGKVLGETVPAPNVSEGSILIKVVNSCISAGTEMSNVAETGKPLIKRVLNMYAVDGFSHQEIAQKLNISVGSSKSRLSRARVMLKDNIKKS